MWSTTHEGCWISRRCARTARWMGFARAGDATSVPPLRHSQPEEPAPTERPLRPIFSFWPAIRQEE